MSSAVDDRHGVVAEFLTGVVCQKADCGADLLSFPSGAVCLGPLAHRYPMSGSSGYLILTADADRGPRAAPASANPPYEDPQFALRYAGLWSFAYAAVMNPELAANGWLVGRGESEPFYRTVASIAAQELRGRNPRLICDVGCGVGRVVHDLAGVYPAATVVGLDRSTAMLDVAAQILRSHDDLAIDLSDAGFGVVGIHRSLVPRRDNTVLVQADAESLALRASHAWHGADLVLLINVLDRTPHPERLLRAAMSLVAARDGAIVLAVSGSWLTAELWRRFPDAVRFCLDELTAGSFEISFAVENLMLREVANSRGVTVDFPLSIIAARKA